MGAITFFTKKGYEKAADARGHLLLGVFSRYYYSTENGE